MKYFLLLISSLLISTAVSHAQIIDDVAKKTKRKTERKVERKVEKKVDNAVDDALDGIFDGKKKKREPEDIGMVYSEDEILEVPAVFPENTFIGSFDLQITTTEGTEHNYHLTFDTYMTAITIPDASTRETWIIDHKEGQIISVKGNNKAFRSTAMVPEGHDESERKVYKTADAKDIEGITCFKYLIEEDGVRSTVWLAEQHSVPMSLIVRTMASQSSGFDSATSLTSIRGIPMESYILHEDGSQSKVQVESVQSGMIDISVFDLTGYNVIDVSELEPYEK